MAKLDNEERDELKDSNFAFPKQRKEPLENASHVRNAIARFNQVEDVSDTERDEAWKRIKAAAKKYGVEVNEGSWRELGKGKGKLATAPLTNLSPQRYNLSTHCYNLSPQRGLGEKS